MSNENSDVVKALEDANLLLYEKIEKNARRIKEIDEEIRENNASVFK